MRDARYVRLISWTLQSGSEQFEPENSRDVDGTSMKLLGQIAHEISTPSLTL
jgi:hypothetical protein